MAKKTILRRLTRNAGLGLAGLAGLVMTSSCMTITDSEGKKKIITFDPVTQTLADMWRPANKADNSQQSNVQDNTQRARDAIALKEAERHVERCKEIGYQQIYDNDMGQMIIVVCNYARDFDGDGKITPNIFDEQRSEIKGMGKRRSTDEQITIYANGSNKVFGLYDDLYDKNGQVIKHEECGGVCSAWGLAPAFKPGELPEGTYIFTIGIKKDGKKRVIGTTDFEVYKK